MGQATERFKLIASDRDGYTFNFDHITKYTLNNNEFIFCESRSWNYGHENIGRAEYIALDMTNQSIHHDWGNVFSDIDIGGKAVVVESDIIISSGWNKFASIDLKSNGLNWVETLPHNAATANLLPLYYTNNLVFASLGNYGNLNILDANTGAHKKVIKDIGTEWFATPFDYYDGLIWFTSTAGLYALDANANIKYALKNEDALEQLKGNFTNGFAIDQSTGYMYGLRGETFVCFKTKH